MKVELIKHWAALFANYIKEEPSEPKLFKWQSQQNFSEHWTLGTGDLYQVYERSFQSQYSTRLWEGSKHSGKSAMLLFIRQNSTFCESMFRDLFTEKNDIALRLSRFIFHCEQMQSEIKKVHPKSVAHHHDYQLLSVYLAFRYPTVHCLFDPNLFAQAGVKIGLRKPPEIFEYARFQKLAKGLATILRNEVIVRSAYPFDINENLLVVHDFYEFVAETNY